MRSVAGPHPARQPRPRVPRHPRQPRARRSTLARRAEQPGLDGVSGNGAVAFDDKPRALAGRRRPARAGCLIGGGNPGRIIVGGRDAARVRLPKGAGGAAIVPENSPFAGMNFGNQKGPTNIKSDTSTWIIKTSLFCYTGHVHAVQAGGDLTSDTLKVQYGKDFNDIKMMYCGWQRADEPGHTMDHQRSCGARSEQAPPDLPWQSGGSRRRGPDNRLH